MIIDIGEGQDIHPRNKQDVANRLARWALAKDYGVKVAYQSPSYKSMEKKDGKIVLTFDDVGGGLSRSTCKEARGSPSPGDDKKFVRAKAKIVGKNQVEVSSDEVSRPRRRPLRLGRQPGLQPLRAATACPSPRSAPTTGRA